MGDRLAFALTYFQNFIVSCNSWSKLTSLTCRQPNSSIASLHEENYSEGRSFWKLKLVVCSHSKNLARALQNLMFVVLD